MAVVSDWQIFRASAIGGRHIDAGLPCQDSAVVRDFGSAKVLTAADGHGSRRHFRSEVGSRLACEAAVEQISSLILTQDDIHKPGSEQLQCLKQSILDVCKVKWKAIMLKTPFPTMKKHCSSAIRTTPSMSPMAPLCWQL